MIRFAVSHVVAFDSMSSHGTWLCSKGLCRVDKLKNVEITLEVGWCEKNNWKNEDKSL